MEEETLPPDWLRGILGMCVLKVLEGGPTYGYAIISSLADAGLGDIKGGTLYPLLTRFENRGLVSIEWRAGEGGPGRKYFALTAEGKRELAVLTKQWGQFTQTINRHLKAEA